MSTDKVLGLLTAFTLAALLAASPVLAEDGSPETPAPRLCSDSSVPSFLGAAGETPEWQPAQTCGPCLLEFCPEVGVRCDFSGCGPGNECCTYSCVCDPTCTNTGTPGNVCRVLIPCCPTCGNNFRECNEVCDGTDLDGKTCVDLGFHDGTLACLSNCSGFDTSGCVAQPVCGNDICEWGEDCETCSEDCDSKQNGPPPGRFCCGNGVTESAEGDCSICDGNC